jgi:glycerophosphocholine phosphodiesterase GPCPD1
MDGNIIRENTIASLKKAGLSGADMVEFDVQLSKDLVPVIYHDFHVYVSLKRKKTLEEFDMLELPVRDLTLEQLKNLKVYHVTEGRSGAPVFFDEDLDEHQPFPTLSEAMDVIDPNVGFNIEVKSSMELFDGTKEADITIEKNLYINYILEVVLSKPTNRRIVFSSFDPDVCAMLRYKQNIYPVMFLTLGITQKYPSYHDPRCNTIESAVRSACAMEFLGIVAHTEDLLRDETQIAYAKKQNLIIFCWGDDNNCKDTIRRLKQLGIHAIIYDKMHVLSDKSKEENIFLVGANDPQNDLRKIQELDIEATNEKERADSKKRKHSAATSKENN